MSAMIVADLLGALVAGSAIVADVAMTLTWCC
jgi:hypothetical protein